MSITTEPQRSDGLVDDIRVIPRPSRRRGELPPVAVRSTSEPNDQQQAASRASWSGIGWLLYVVAAASFGFLGLTGRADTTAGLFGVPVAALTVRWTLQRFGHIAPDIASILFAGFAWRCLAAVPRLLGGADALVYQREGTRLASHFRNLDFAVDTGRSIPGTGTLRYLAGLVSVLTQSTYVLTFIVFALLAFAGQVWIATAVRPILSERQFRLFVLLLMFWPTMAFWPSSIGKESVMLFGIGLAFHGMTRLYSRDPRGAIELFIGAGAVLLVRPHMAMVVASGALGGLCARKAEGRSRTVVQIASLALVIVVASWASQASATLFGLDNFDGLSDVGAALDFAEQRTSQDASQFVAPRVESALDYPWAVATVLFRPFPDEAPNTTALMSSIEGLVLAALIIASAASAIGKNVGVRRHGALLFALVYAAVFVFMFSAIGNFGILSRQRAQVVPFVLLLVSLGLGSLTPAKLRRST